MLSPRLRPRLAMLVMAAAVGVAVFTLRPGTAPDATSTLRADPNIGPFQGMGVWIDIHDEAARADPAGTAADIAAHGARTVYLQTSNFQRPFPFVDKRAVGAFLDAAHAEGLKVVAWYLPGFVDVPEDAGRAKEAIRFRTEEGNRFDGFALDIEAPNVKDPRVRTERLLLVSRRLRASAGEDYPLGAIIPSPRGVLLREDYWPGFPFAALAAVYDTILPMSYFTWNHPTEESTRFYITQNIRIIRRQTGSNQVPIHVIGGIAQDASLPQTQAFVEALRERGVIGGSYYTYTGVDEAEWDVLGEIPVNPVQNPALPVRPGAPQLGNIQGADTSHATGVVYSVAGSVGDRTLAYDAFDAQAGEITVYVNWTEVATIEAGPDGAWTGTRELLIVDDLWNDEKTNTVAFVPKDPNGTWGVRSVSVAMFLIDGGG